MPDQVPDNTSEQVPAFIRRSQNSEELGVRSRNYGPVNRLGAESLERPLELPREDFKKVLYIVAVAVVLCVGLLVAYNTTVIASRQEAVQQVEGIINRGVTLDLPNMQECAGKSNEEILGMFNASGYAIFDNTADEDRSVNGFDVYKLASDVTVEEAAAAYARGLDSIDPTEAAKVISGSWRYLVDRSGDTEMRLRYVDFAATTPTTAINDVMALQQFDSSKAGEVEQDSIGNTNVNGTFEKDGKTYSYTISVCDLSQVYDVEGLPETAQYVGVKVTG